MTRSEIITHITTDISYNKLCKKLCGNNSDDVYQEILVLLLEMDEQKLPQKSFLNFWYVRVAMNMCSKNGIFGRLYMHHLVDKNVDVYNLVDKNVDVYSNVNMSDEEVDTNDYECAEDVMLLFDEFTNRVVHLYNQTGSMLAVNKMTGISYSALRKVKEKMKHESNTNNTKHG